MTFVCPISPERHVRPTITIYGRHLELAWWLPTYPLHRRRTTDSCVSGQLLRHSDGAVSGSPTPSLLSQFQGAMYAERSKQSTRLTHRHNKNEAAGAPTAPPDGSPSQWS